MTESFMIAQLEAGEHVVFGIALETSSSSFSLNGFQVAGSTKETRKGITDRRVIVEVSTGEITTVANAEVRTVSLGREKQLGVEMLRIESVTDGAGRTVALGIGGLDPTQEAQVKALFPSASLVAKKKGLLSFLGL
jgi:hypothetical protein